MNIPVPLHLLGNLPGFQGSCDGGDVFFVENELLPTLGLGECEAIFGVIVDQGYSATTYI